MCQAEIGGVVRHLERKSCIHKKRKELFRSWRVEGCTLQNTTSILAAESRFSGNSLLRGYIKIFYFLLEATRALKLSICTLTLETVRLWVSRITLHVVAFHSLLLRSANYSYPFISVTINYNHRICWWLVAGLTTQNYSFAHTHKTVRGNELVDCPYHIGKRKRRRRRKKRRRRRRKTRMKMKCIKVA